MPSLDSLTAKQLRDLMQSYIDDSSIESDQFLEGLDVTEPAAVELFNDFLLFLEHGDQLNVKEQYEPVKSNLG